MLVWLAPWLSGSLLPQSDPEFKIYSPSPWCSHWGALETNLQFSPLGLVPKKDGSQHIIMNLSSPRCFSINDFTSKEDYTLHYATFNHALAPVPLFGTSALTAELDLKHTFCLCSVSPSNWYLLPMHWQGKFFVDLRLPFGLHSSPILSLTVSLMPLSGKAPSNSLPTTLEFAGIPFSVVPDNGTHSQHKSYSYITLPFSLSYQVSFQTIKLYLAGIRFVHIENSIADLFADAPSILFTSTGHQVHHFKILKK